MNILHLSRGDGEGGATLATYQIHAMLRDAGYRSIMAVRNKRTLDPDVIPVGVRGLQTCTWSERIERIWSRMSGGYRVEPINKYAFNKNVAPVPDWDEVLTAMPNPDVIFLHWISGMVTAADIRRLAERVACPIVWLLMDMEPMTGGCHYPGSCERYSANCTNCPQLRGGNKHNWARRTWNHKRRHLSDLQITFVAPTGWLADRLARCSLFQGYPIEQIPLPVNSRMRSLEKSLARSEMGLPIDKKIILVGSHDLNDRRKGMGLLIAAAKALARQKNQNADPSSLADTLLFLLIGLNGHELKTQIPFASLVKGYIENDMELTRAYQAADVFACPSVEDAGPMMVSQAMMCGTPVVAFGTGIVPELIASGQGGYMARMGDADDFAYGLNILLADNGPAGRRAAEIASRHHDPKRIIRAYDEMIRRIFGSKQRISP